MPRPKLVLSSVLHVAVLRRSRAWFSGPLSLRFKVDSIVVVPANAVKSTLASVGNPVTCQPTAIRPEYHWRLEGSECVWPVLSVMRLPRSWTRPWRCSGVCRNGVVRSHYGQATAYNLFSLQHGNILH